MRTREDGVVVVVVRRGIGAKMRKSRVDRKWAIGEGTDRCERCAFVNGELRMRAEGDVTS